MKPKLTELKREINKFQVIIIDLNKSAVARISRQKLRTK